MSECRIWPGRTEFRQDDREDGVLSVPTRDAWLAGRGANGVGSSGARLVILGSGTVPASNVAPVHAPATLPLAPSFVPPAARVANAVMWSYRTHRRPRLQTGKYRRRPLGKT